MEGCVSGRRTNSKLEALLNRCMRDAGFTQEEKNLNLIAAAQHVLGIRILVDSSSMLEQHYPASEVSRSPAGSRSSSPTPQRKIWDEAWEMLRAAEAHSEEHRWHPKIFNELTVLRSIIILRQSIKKMEDCFEVGAYVAFSSPTTSLTSPSNSVDVSSLDSALRFAVEAQTHVSHRAEVQHVLSIHQEMVRIVKLVRECRLAILDGWDSFEPGRPLSRVLLDGSVTSGISHRSARVELRSIRTTALNSFLERSVASALSQHGPKGTIGMISLSSINPTPLLRSLEAARMFVESNEFALTSEVSMLLDDADLVVRARRSLFVDGGGGGASISSMSCDGKNDDLMDVLREFVHRRKERDTDARTTVELELLRREIVHADLVHTFRLVLGGQEDNDHSSGSGGSGVLPSVAEIEGAIFLAKSTLEDNSESFLGGTMRTSTIMASMAAAECLASLV